MQKKATLKTLFLSSIIILLALTFLSYFQIKSFSESASWENHSKTVEITLEKIYSNILALESNLRGFVLSKNETFLISLNNRNAELNINLDLVQNLIKDDPTRMKKLSEIRNLVTSNRIFFRELTTKSQNDKVPIEAWFERKKMLDEMKNKIFELKLEEYKLAQKSGTIFTKSNSLLPFFTFFLTIVSILSLLFAYNKIRRDLNAYKKLKIRLELKTRDIAASKEQLTLQNIEIKKRAIEISDANIELAFQNTEKEKRAEELKIANTELAFQNNEKEKRTDELTIANKKLALQNEEKERQAKELKAANKELDAFVYVSSHDLQEPLRKIQMFCGRLLEKEAATLSETGKDYFKRMLDAASRMQTLIKDLLAFSRLNTEERNFEETNMSQIIEEVRTELWEMIEEKEAKIEIEGNCTLKIIPFQFRQLITNLVSNSLKFSKTDLAPFIKIKFKGGENLPSLEKNKRQKNKFFHLHFSDNGIGFEPEYQDKIFEIFQRLHGKEVYIGTGIGLAIVKKVVENHHGFIFAKGVLGEGSQFDIYLPE